MFAGGPVAGSKAVFQLACEALGRGGSRVVSYAGRSYVVAPLGISAVMVLLVLWLLASVVALILCRDHISLHGLSGLQDVLSRLRC